MKNELRSDLQQGSSSQSWTFELEKTSGLLTHACFTLSRPSASTPPHLVSRSLESGKSVVPFVPGPYMTLPLSKTQQAAVTDAQSSDHISMPLLRASLARNPPLPKKAPRFAVRAIYKTSTEILPRKQTTTRRTQNPFALSALLPTHPFLPRKREKGVGHVSMPWSQESKSMRKG